jgi:hypothetical protein
MRIIVRTILALVLLSAIGLIAFLFHGSKGTETWATITGLLAVLAAVIAAYPALRVLDIQEDSLKPRPTLYFDLSSRYGLAQLRVKNIGGSVAYDVHLKWKIHPRDHKGDEVTALDYISSLLPAEDVSTLLGQSSEVVQRYSNNLFEGEIAFKDAKGKVSQEKFSFSADAHQKRLYHDEELPKTLRDLQRIPDNLERVVAVLEKIREDQRIFADQGEKHLPDQ